MSPQTRAPFIAGAAALLLHAPMVRATACVDYRNYLGPMGTVVTPGDARDVAVVGNFAYVADLQGGLAVIDVSDPNTPKRISSIDTPGHWAWSVAASGSYVYVADSDRISIVDVSSPQAPVILATITPGGETRDVALDGSVLWATGRLGLVAIDVSSPGAPHVRGSLSLPHYARAVSVDGGIACVAADYALLLVVDVHDPSAPSLSAAVSLEATPYAVAVKNGLCLAGSYLLQAFDVTNPLQPQSLGTLRLDERYSVAILGVAFDGPFAYAQGLTPFSDNLYVIDASAPATLSVLGTCSAAATSSESSPGVLAVSGGKAYLATGWESGLRIVNVSNPHPVPVRSAASGFAAYGVAAAGPLAITVSGAKLSVIDASVDPPQLRGSVAVPGEHVVATDHLALIAAGNAGLQLVDFSDPSAPAIVGSAAIPSYMVSVSRTLACVAAGNTVHMIDVSNPHAPVVRGSLAFYTGVQAVDLEGGRLYVACAGYAQDGSLTIVDASDPDHLAALGSVHRPWDEWSAPTGVAVQGTRAYLTLQDIPSLEIIDVSDPMAPHVTASVDVVEPLVDIAVRGTTAYLAAGYAGLVLVDISEGGTPHVIGGLATPDNLLEVAAGSDGVYLGYGFPVRVAPLQCGPTILAHGSAQFEEGGLATRPATPAVAPPLSLQAAHPSPFRERTGLSFALSQTRAARVSVYDVTGRLVRTLLDTELTAGGHEIAWDGKDGRGAAVAPGTYFVRLQAGQQSAVQRVTRVR